MTLLAEDVDARVERSLTALRREFPADADRIDEIGRSQFERLRAGARIEDFLPVLVYRFTREELENGADRSSP
jgi:hypothetical protein